MRTALRWAARTARPATRLAGSLGRPGLTIVGWHRVDDSGAALSTPTGVFGRQLDVLNSWGARVLPLEDAVRLLAAGSLPQRAVALTFDDGYASALESAWPQLRERGLPATAFVVSGYLDGSQRFPWDAGACGDHVRVGDRTAVLAASAEGLCIGSHTVTHRWLPHLRGAELADELSESRAELEDLLGRPVHTVAYPTGGWNALVRDAAEQAGYRIGITVDRGRNGRGQHPLALRRAFAPDDVDDFRLILDGAYTWLRPLDGWRTRNGPRW